MKKFDLARDALRFLIREYEIKEIYIPYYLCDVIRHSIIAENCNPIFYHIDDNFFPSKDFPTDSFILYPNYFGICEMNVDVLVKKYPKIIIDNAHSFYSDPKGFATFNSARKFLPVDTGANLWIGDTEKNILKKDYIRRNKFDFFHLKYGKDNLLKISITKDCIPFCYPYLAESIGQADYLVKQLEDDGLTIYRYWNNLPRSYNEYKFYSRLVPIPLNY